MSKIKRCLSDIKNAFGASLPRDPDDPEAVICAQESLKAKGGGYLPKDTEIILCVQDQYGVDYPTVDGVAVIERPDEWVITMNADGALVFNLYDAAGNLLMGPFTETDAQVSGNAMDGWVIIDDSGDQIIIPAPSDFSWQITQDADGNVTFQQTFNGVPVGPPIVHAEDDAAFTANPDGSYTLIDDNGNTITIPAPVPGDLTFTFGDGSGPIVVDNNAPDTVPFDSNFTVNAAGEICFRSVRDTETDGKGQRAFENTGLFTGPAVDAIAGTTVVDLSATATNPSADCDMCYEVYLRGGNISMRLGVPLTDAWLAQTELLIDGSSFTGGFKPSNLIQPNSSGPLFRITWSSNNVTRECIVAPGGTLTAQIILDFIPPVYTPDAQNLFNGQRFNIAMIGKSLPVPC